jgi:hypothetical protein
MAAEAKRIEQHRPLLIDKGHVNIYSILPILSNAISPTLNLGIGLLSMLRLQFLI